MALGIWPVILPHSRFKLSWDILIIILILGATIAVPYRLTFGIDRLDALYWLVTAFFFFDILFNFMTAVKTGIKWLEQPADIARHYLRSWFTVDFLAALPFAALTHFLWYVPAPGTLYFTIFGALRLLRMLKVLRINSYAHKISNHLSLNPGLMRLIIFLCWFTLISHLMALGWIVIGAGVRAGAGAVLDDYVRALYWCLTTIATIGYGDITPDHASNLQLVYTMMVELLGVAMYGYIIGNISSLVANIDVNKAAYMRKMEEVNLYLRNHRIPLPLQERIRHYYRYMWETRKNVSSAALPAEMPHSLSIDILLFLNRTIIDKVSLFKDMEEVFIREAVQLLDPLVFLPDELIIRQGEYGDCMYFLSSGEVDVIVNGQKIAALSAGSYFGETALVMGEQRNATIRTQSYCDLYKLSHQSFELLRKRYPNFDAHVKAIAAQRLQETLEKTHHPH